MNLPLTIARAWNRAVFYLKSLSSAPGAAKDLDEELRFHMEMQAEQNRQSGMSEKEAWYAARRQFGTLEMNRDECRDQRPTRWLEDLASDLSIAVRSLRKRPVMTLVAVLSLAIGIGANSALFSVMDATLLHAVPLPDAGRLVAIDEFKKGEPSNGNPPRTYDWGSLIPGLETVYGGYTEQVVWSGEGDSTKLEALRTCGDPLRTLNIQPESGRGFTPAEQRGIGNAVMISHEAWLHRFGGKPDVVGEQLIFGGKGYRVVGILPAGLTYPSRADVWLPMSEELQRVDRRAGFVLTTGRLKPGVRREELQQQANVAAAELARQYPATDGTRSAHVTPLNEFETREARRPLLLLWATALLVLLLACVNFSSLCLSRGLARQREASIRLALGAGTFRLVRLYLTECLLMALVGGAVGLVAARASLKSLVSALPADLPNVEAVALNGRVVVLTLLLAVIAGALAGWIPAWRIARGAASDRLTERAGTNDRQLLWFQKGLLTCQIALSVALLTGAALLAHSLLRLTSQPLGFQPEHVLAVKIGLSWDTPEKTLNGFSTRALEGFGAIPGVRAVGMIDRLPLTGGSQNGHFSIRNHPMPDGRDTAEVSLRATAGNYFSAAGIPLVAGRLLSDIAPPDAREVLVNQAFVRRYFQGLDPLTQSLDVSGLHSTHQWSQVVGVLADVRQEAVKEAPAEVYVAAHNTYWPLLTFVLRGEGDPHALVSSVRAVVHQIDPSQSIDSVVTLEDAVAATRTQPRLRTIALGAFAAVAMLLAALGIYGLQSQTVSQRSREIAVRLALGAKPAEAMRAVLKQNAVLLGLGLALGAGSAVALAILLKSVIYGVPALDPVAFLAGGTGLALTALAASFIPARRAATVDPASTLRHE